MYSFTIQNSQFKIQQVASTNFIDYVKINCRSGKGGKGFMHFFRAKGVPNGGPDGGDGGRGGHIILRGNSNLWTLLHLRYKKHIHADDGAAGEESDRTGASGKDIIIDVPLGTIIKNAETGELITEITAHEEERILFAGGKGGYGNTHFKNSTNQAPTYVQPGEMGTDLWVVMELKVLADVGLVGFPNAGKSTLLSVVSAAKPEIADYPFTTITPNLGVVAYRDYRSFIMADIPGIIEGAAEGKGLGTRFLRHIERNSILLFMISAESENIKVDFDILLEELRQYNPELMDKKRLLAITKMDLLDTKGKNKLEKTVPKDLPYIFISSVAQKNIDKLKDLLWDAINN